MGAAQSAGGESGIVNKKDGEGLSGADRAVKVLEIWCNPF